MIYKLIFLTSLLSIKIIKLYAYSSLSQSLIWFKSKSHLIKGLNESSCKRIWSFDAKKAIEIGQM